MKNVDHDIHAINMSTGAPTETPPKSSGDSHGEKYNSDEKSSMDSTRENSATDGLLKEEQDVEAQKKEEPIVAVEHYVSMKAKMLFLAMYFLLNLTLTISNKAVLGKVSIHRIYEATRMGLTRSKRRAFHGSSRHSTHQQHP